ncbi:cytochrome P450 81Q32-like isoform X2 [Mercurialis annua]|uniref:cytochrome P450 81Q32-like isoform X2 n=1 Tax=Mercurialis annua TaxID=3986 RepID=UPI00215E22EE|nr:cytochrome P450 81Q32-like isoform X2 [Mercurialis annua]
MEGNHWLNWAVLVPVLFFLLAAKFMFHKLKIPKNLPPSPPARPIVGHFHLLKQPVHQTLHELAKKYGEILFLRYGNRKVLVISSPSAVEECFTKNDVIFANRPRSLAGKHLNYNCTTMGSCNYGDHWRNLRRLTTIELFSTSRTASFSGIRTEEEILKETEALRGSSNLYDYFPVLRWVDYQGVEKKMLRLKKKMDSFLQDLIEEHRRARAETESSATLNLHKASNQKLDMTLIDVMLSLKETEPEFYTDQTIKGVILTILTAGSQTSAATLEWAMSLLLNHPEALQKAVAEIDVVVGIDKLLSETDVQKLSFLQNVINETFRLFPTAPLLLPHESSADCTVCGYDVARGTLLLVNTWSMNRNPKLWEDPEKFMPERFEGGEGEENKLLPFGAGRRACPGAGLAKRVISLTLGSLIQSFEWERVCKEEINMEEGTGLTMPKAIPLEAFCKPRQAMVNLLSTL